jgi:hypothetical protein
MFFSFFSLLDEKKSSWYNDGIREKLVAEVERGNGLLRSEVISETISYVLQS